MPKVSIIVNLYNGAPWIREALCSVFVQTYTDWELIVWDDCSTDGGVAVVEEYVGDPRVRLVRGSVRVPLGKARVEAISHATGEWMAFLDQDDIWMPDKLERQLALVENDLQQKVGLVYGRSLAFADGGLERDLDVIHEFRPLPEGKIFRNLFRSSCFFTISSALMRRSAYVEAQVALDQFELISDYMLFIELSWRWQVRAVQGVVCRYRLHPGSLSHMRQMLLHQEALAYAMLWKGRVDPEDLAWCVMRHSNLLAKEEMRVPATFGQGLRRLLQHGSLGFIASRPFVRAFRVLRRNLATPYWKRPSASMSSAPGRNA